MTWERRCQAVGCPKPPSAGLAVGTVAGFVLYVQICADHAAEIVAMRERLPEGLRNWSGRVTEPPT